MAERLGNSPIGRPLKNTTVLVMSKSGMLLPPYETGEIWIGGETIVMGYLGKSELTAEKFRAYAIAAQLMDNTKARLYRTGDLGWVDHTELLHFIGRADRQIKLRGYRVEPEDIESVIAACPGVVCAAVKLVKTTEEKAEDRLHAFVERRSGVEVSVQTLSDHVRAYLPDYMWPSGFTILDNLPRTPIGKLISKR